ncbi:hypothetical protein ACJ72_00490 [Emergomyces africanus]|uniref:Uncharacterized protein n=1 Tax=Emergomyces africanus TaxID=1955775 RepID=A0A1B7P802_9EURO|nr:hypothetical protein ACJ72_00490 [Emergomyces africanus]
MAMSAGLPEIHANSLFILLSDRGETFTFHWGLIMESRSLLTALQVAVVEPVLQESLGDRLAEVNTGYSNCFHEDMTCRVWVKETLSELEIHGYINLVKDVAEIERKASTRAVVNKFKQTREVAKSEGTAIYLRWILVSSGADSSTLLRRLQADKSLRSTPLSLRRYGH